MQNRHCSVARDGNNLYIYKLSHPSCISSFIRAMQEGTKRGYECFNIYWKGTGVAVYPNACLPIAGIIEFYKGNGIEFAFNIDTSEYLNNCHFAEPIYINPEEIASLITPFDKVIKYDNSAQVAAFTQKCVDTISHQVLCEDGIFESLIWCINEVMDNVLLHSNGNSGFVMAQFHTVSKHIAICVSDTGIGIFNSLRGSTHHPRRTLDALSLAIQEGVGDGLGQGNGLYGLYQIIQANGGRLTLTSGSASLMLANENTLQRYEHLPYISGDTPGTVVDFQLDLNKKVDIKKAFSSIGGFDGFDIRLDNMLQENDSILYDVYTNCEGTATRDAGKLLRFDVLNTFRRTKSKICLDFTNIATVSSSFVDEFIGKMVIELGFVLFNQVISIVGMNRTVQYLCERSVYMRIYTEWSKNRAAQK